MKQDSGVGAHFYGDGESITDYSLETFYGPGILFSVRDMEVTDRVCERAIGKEIREGDIVVVRNDTGVKVSKQEVYLEGITKLPILTSESAEWLAEKRVKMLVLDSLRLGEDILA